MAKILLLDDDVKLATVVKEALAAEGHVVDHVETGEDALYRLKYHHYDLAVVDWMLPDIEGVEVCKQYREFGGKIPVIFLTGRTETDHKIEAFDIGADDYL
ncbi:MAG TPA: response regulator, partial [Chroococcales cyanobacterium]